MCPTRTPLRGQALLVSKRQAFLDSMMQHHGHISRRGDSLDRRPGHGSLLMEACSSVSLWVAQTLELFGKGVWSSKLRLQSDMVSNLAAGSLLLLVRPSTECRTMWPVNQRQ